MKTKSIKVAYIYWLFLGFFGGHWFYLKCKSRGYLRLLTLNMCGIGWIIDGCILWKEVKKFNEDPETYIAIAEVKTDKSLKRMEKFGKLRTANDQESTNTYTKL